MNKVIVLIVILVVVFVLWPKSKEGFENWGTNYENIKLSKVARQIGGYGNSQNPWDNGFYGHRGWINPTDANGYANTIAQDLQHTFPSPMSGPSWDPSSYRDVQMPNGQFVGMIESN